MRTLPEGMWPSLWQGLHKQYAKTKKKKSIPQNLKIQKENFRKKISPHTEKEAYFSPTSLNDNALQSLLSTLHAPKSCTYISKYLHIRTNILPNSIFSMFFRIQVIPKLDFNVATGRDYSSIRRTSLNSVREA